MPWLITWSRSTNRLRAALRTSSAPAPPALGPPRVPRCCSWTTRSPLISTRSLSSRPSEARNSAATCSSPASGPGTSTRNPWAVRPPPLLNVTRASNTARYCGSLMSPPRSPCPDPGSLTSSLSADGVIVRGLLLRELGQGCARLPTRDLARDVVDRDLGDPAAERLGGAQVGRRRYDVGAGVAVRLRHRAGERAESVEVLRAAGRRVPARVQTRAHPVHAVLGGQHEQLEQGVLLVAVDVLAVREAGGHLVLPALAVGPRLRARLREPLERGRRGAHVGGSAEHDRVGSVEGGEERRVGVVDRQQRDLDAGHRTGAGGHGGRLPRRVPRARVVGDRDADPGPAHDDSFACD